MEHHSPFRSLSFALCALACSVLGPALFAQEGMEAVENTRLTIVPNSLTFGDVEFPAHTITVHGTNANKLFQLWRTEMRAQSRDIKGRNPTIARGVVIPEVHEGPIDVLARTTGDRKAGLAQLTMAFALNDSTPLPHRPEQERYMHQLAVRYNQAVVDAEIAAKQKELERAKKRSDRERASEDRTRKRLQRAEDKLEQARLKRERAEAGKAEYEGTVIGLERRQQLTENAADERRLIKARQKLAKREAQVLKLREREAKWQAQVNDHRGDLPEHDRVQQDRSEEVERIEREINALEVTRDSFE